MYLTVGARISDVAESDKESRETIEETGILDESPSGQLGASVREKGGPDSVYEKV